MATLDVINLEKQKVGTIDLPDDIVNAPVDEHLFYEVVKAQLASRRAGTQSVKNRTLVSGGGKRSEEHTSELQSQSNLVCRLLLEKKKTRRRKGMPRAAAGWRSHRWAQSTSPTEPRPLSR